MHFGDLCFTVVSQPQFQPVCESGAEQYSQRKDLPHTQRRPTFSVLILWSRSLSLGVQVKQNTRNIFAVLIGIQPLTSGVQLINNLDSICHWVKERFDIVLVDKE